MLAHLELHRHYSEFIEISKDYTIYRFEIEFRPDVAQSIPFQNLKDETELLGIFLTRLKKMDVPVFENVQYDKILTKRKKVSSNLLGGDVYKLDKYKRDRDLKIAITYINKLQSGTGIDVFETRKWLMEEGGADIGHSRKEEFMLYYQNTLDTISEFLRDGNVRYSDFTKIITGHIEYLEQMTGVDFKYFMNVISGYINSDLKEFSEGHYKNFVLMAYVFYKRNIAFISENTLFFLNVFDRNEILDFGDKHLISEVKRLTKGKTVQFILKELDKNGNDPEFIMKLFQIITNSDQYS